MFGRRLPRNAILIQHEDSSFALYQNVRAAGIDTGIVVPDRTVIARTGATTTHLKLSVTHPTRDDFEWQFRTKHHPRGVRLRPGEIYLRADSDLAHPINAVERTYTADAGDYPKNTYRKGETVRIHSRFAYPTRAKVRYALRGPGSRKLTYFDARLDPGRKASHYDLRPDKAREAASTWTILLYFDKQVMDSVRFRIKERNP